MRNCLKALLRAAAAIAEALARIGAVRPRREQPRQAIVASAHASAPRAVAREFEAAAAAYRSLSAERPPPTELALRFYALYKQATDGDAPPTPALSDLRSRVKHGAWAELRGTAPADAMRAFVAELGVLRERHEGDTGDWDDDDDDESGGIGGPPPMSTLAHAGARSLDAPPDDSDMAWAAMHGAARRGDAAAIASMIAEGVAVDIRDDDLHTALHWASDGGHARALEVLARAGARVDARNCDGCSPLHMACGGDHREAALLLVRAGADVEARDNDGESALDFASEELAALLKRAACGT